MRTYRETFDNGRSGWFGWIDNARGPKPLERGESTVTSRNPWWIDYNHAPPGAGYLVWRSQLPEGYVTLDKVRITFPG